MASIGRFGLPHRNHAGIRFATFLEINNLVACSTYFRKKNYATWRHPRSKLQHQIDHIIDFSRIIDVFVSKPLLDTDHLSVRMKLRIASCLYRKSQRKVALSKFDSNKLITDQATRNNFNNALAEKLLDSTRVDFELFERSVVDAASSTLPKSTRPCPDWFTQNQEELLYLIERRNTTVHNKIKCSTRSTISAAKRARNELKNAINQAKSTWIANLCTDINSGPNPLNRGTTTFWDAIKRMKKGLTKPPPSVQVMMQKIDGSKCTTPEENAEVFRAHFVKLYNREEMFDPSILQSIPQSSILNSLSAIPDALEIKKAVFRLKNKAPGLSGITAPMLKSLADNDHCFNYFVSIIVDIWSNESYPSTWDFGKLVILPKKGDLSRPGNYRGIMLLETAYKVLAIILHSRLQPLVESIDHEAQCGFRQGRGCMDAVFSIKMALKKRREHNLESWVLFLDLVKAFDRVPRSLLWQVLQKFGVPDKTIAILTLLHTNFQVSFEIDSVLHTMPCTIGVKQGNILGPVLFVIFISAVMITWRNFYTNDHSVCIVRKRTLFSQVEDTTLKDQNLLLKIPNTQTTPLLSLSVEQMSKPTLHY